MPAGARKRSIATAHRVPRTPIGSVVSANLQVPMINGQMVACAHTGNAARNSSSGRTWTRQALVCAPNQHVVIESRELLAMLEASGKTRISVEFEVRRAWWGGSLMFNPVGVDGHRYGSWVTADGHA